MRISLVRGGGRYVEDPEVSICFSTSAASSGVALGKMPGSVKLVLSSEMTTNTKSTPPITGMKTVRCSTRKGQSNAKKRPHVTTIRPSVRGRTPLCLAKMIRPSQKNRFFPGNTSHFLRGRCALFPAWHCAEDGDTDSARGSICWYSQFFIVENRTEPVWR